ncbi:MAG: hypothetical protein OWU32_11595 [Firmicutes bacterium]|nr:hypothetical protein [Bacillota bacterium]
MRRFITVLVIPMCVWALALLYQGSEDGFARENARQSSDGAQRLDDGSLTAPFARGVLTASPSRFESLGSSVAFAAPPDLNGEHFVTPLLGYGVTGAGNLLITRDGGRSWMLLLHAPGADFTALTWEGQVGVASGLSLYSGSGLAIPTLAVTTNDGLSWTLRDPTFPPMYSVMQRAGWQTLVAHPITARELLLLPVPALESQVPAYGLISMDGGTHFEPLWLGHGWQPTGGVALLSAGRFAITVQGTPSAGVEKSGVAILRDSGHLLRLYSAVLPLPLYAVLPLSAQEFMVAGGTFPEYSPATAYGFYHLFLHGDGKFVPLDVVPDRRAMNYGPMVALSRGSDGLLYALEGGVPLGGNPPAQGQLMISRDGGHRFVSTGVTGSMLDVLGRHSWLLTGPNPWSYQVSPMRAWYSASAGRKFTLLPTDTAATPVTAVNVLGLHHVLVTTAHNVWVHADEGGTWVREPWPPATYAGVGEPFLLRMQSGIDGSTGLALSDDCGGTWHSRALPEWIANVDDASVSVGGFIAITAEDSGSSGDSLVTSADGGRAWRTASKAFADSGLSAVFLNPQLGYVFDGNFQLNQGTQWERELWHTADGAKTWHPFPIAPLTLVSSGDVTATRHTLILAGEVELGTQPLYSVNGMSEAHAVLVLVDTVTGRVRAWNLGRHIPKQISFVSSQVGVMETMEGRLYETRDGGEAWSPLVLQVRGISPMY